MRCLSKSMPPHPIRLRLDQTALSPDLTILRQIPVLDKTTPSLRLTRQDSSVHLFTIFQYRHNFGAMALHRCDDLQSTVLSVGVVSRSERQYPSAGLTVVYIPADDYAAIEIQTRVKTIEQATG